VCRRSSITNILLESTWRTRVNSLSDIVLSLKKLQASILRRYSSGEREESCSAWALATFRHSS
jgi:hypothetical protein